MRHRLYGGVRGRGREAPPTRFKGVFFPYFPSSSDDSILPTPDSSGKVILQHDKLVKTKNFDLSHL